MCDSRNLCSYLRSPPGLQTEVTPDVKPQERTGWRDGESERGFDQVQVGRVHPQVWSLRIQVQLRGQLHQTHQGRPSDHASRVQVRWNCMFSS